MTVRTGVQKLVGFTGSDGTLLWLNPVHVTHVMQVNASLVRIYFTDGTHVVVAGDLDDVVLDLDEGLV